MDMDTNAVVLGRSRQPTDITVHNGSDSSDLQGALVSARNRLSFRDVVTGHAEPTQQDNFISALDVELAASDVLISRDVVEASSVEVDSLEPAVEKDNGSGGPMYEGRVPAATTMS
ncbi:hypothetical protein V6N13_088366 [Hibiscus sabdariffa]|uniref:Uncharacterized protein n=1 Tax=Hibiscus sabdariffa TaxID=183260 RepID=A0ABR2FZ50_9ROSI